MVGSTGSIMGPRAAIWLPPMQTGVKLWQDGRTWLELPSHTCHSLQGRAPEWEGRGAFRDLYMSTNECL